MQNNPDAAAVVKLQGEMSLRTISEAHSALSSAFAVGGNVIADIRDISDPDLSFVQLLISALRTAQQSGQTFSLSVPADADLQKIIRRGGFNTPDLNALWQLPQGE